MLDRNVLDYQQKQQEERTKREYERNAKLKEELIKKSQSSMAEKVQFEN